MGTIYLSYRRQDAAAHAGRLADVLKQRYGEDSVLIDVAGFQLGDDLAEGMVRAVEAAAVVLVVIGPDWLHDRDRSGQRRIDDPGDFVRAEVAAALARGARVIPVLVGDARMPAPDELPTEVAGLARRQAIQLRDDRWAEDVQRLAAVLEPSIGRPAPAGKRPGKSKVRDEVVTPARPSAGKSTDRVFISYDFEDQGHVDRIVRGLEADGLHCWIAARDLPKGRSYAREIPPTIRSSKVMVVIVSRHSSGSEDVLSEVTLAKNSGVPRLPVRIDDSPLGDGLEYFFTQSVWLELSPDKLEEELPELVRSVRAHLEGR